MLLPFKWKNKTVKRKIIVAAAAFALLAGLFFFFGYQNNHIAVSKIKLSNENIGALKIVHLSDLHGKQFGQNNKKLAGKITALNPDLIVLTGDMLDVSGKNTDETIDFLAALNKTAAVVWVSGNHEWDSGARDEIVRKLKEKDIMVLENEIASLNIGGNEINILGLDEVGGYYAAGADIPSLFLKLSKLRGLKIVLSHYPENYALTGEKSYNQYGFDLMFSGHAHGGQISLPFIGGLFSPGQGFDPRYYRGLYDGRLIVSAGLGNSRFPFRLFNYPQIVLAEIN